MADVRAYCLAEYERIWGRPWDETWPESHQHILNMRETAKRAHAVWSGLQRAVKEAVDFVESQGLPPHTEPNFVARKGKAVVVPLAGKTVYATFIIHDWLRRYLDAVDALLEEDVERVHSPRSDLAELLGRTLLEEPAPPAGTIPWNTGRVRGRELTEREMAYVSLLVGNEPPSVKRRLKDELVSVENVIEMEREAINSARVRHDAGKKEALAQRAAASSSQRTTGSRRASVRPRRRS
ncbi:hypothetical protein [Sorangium sp. So ce861]|uniref:hypothetical protein n=1 Tax=Sorangium sp. So ce861 TaxID=3133323 RepID=UPI003F61BF30